MAIAGCGAWRHANANDAAELMMSEIHAFSCSKLVGTIDADLRPVSTVQDSLILVLFEPARASLYLRAPCTASSMAYMRLFER